MQEGGQDCMKISTYLLSHRVRRNYDCTDPETSDGMYFIQFFYTGYTTQAICVVIHLFLQVTMCQVWEMETWGSLVPSPSGPFSLVGTGNCCSMMSWKKARITRHKGNQEHTACAVCVQQWDWCIRRTDAVPSALHIFTQTSQQPCHSE